MGDGVPNEPVVLGKQGATSTDLEGGRLRDPAQNRWRLAPGQLPPGREITIRRFGRPMSMNNDGDTIQLLDPAGVAGKAITHLKVGEGEVVRP